MEDGEDKFPRVILSRVFGTFKSCIEGFQYCKPIVQVDREFLTEKYRGTLLTAIGQDGSRNNFPLAFAIVKSETKESWMWFLHYLRRYVTPQPNLCIISDKGINLLVALQSERVGWNESDVLSVYCIHHIASNFNKQFKNVDLKKQVINMDWLNQIPKSKWTQAYGEGKWYDRMTTNLVECMNYVLKGA
ncbi:hypothetical protein GmHk_15G045028 [Glycine max]|nr:hypothetical protein GmHk_15G045028 [Glycine max]